MEENAPKVSALKTWVIILVLVFGIVIMGFFTFFVVGDWGQPSWDYRPARDVPGESPYAIYPELPYPQHVRGAKGE